MLWKWVLITVEIFMISNERILIGFRRVTVVAESGFFMSVSLFACISAALTRRISVICDSWDLPCDSVETTQIWLKSGRNIWHLTWKTKYILLLKLNRHINALIEWNDNRVLGLPRRYKHSANAPRCCIIHSPYDLLAATLPDSQTL